jgi:uncharacterized protein YukE
METDAVRTTAQQMQLMADNLEQYTRDLNNSINVLQNSWRGPSSHRFSNELHYLLQGMQGIATQGDDLSQRVYAEVTEWEEVDNSWRPITTNIPGWQFDYFLQDGLGSAEAIHGGGPVVWGEVSGGGTGVRGHTQDFLLSGQQVNLYHRYRAGEMTFPRYVETDWSLYKLKGEQEIGAAAWGDTWSGDLGQVEAQVFSAEAGSTQEFKIGKEGVTVGAEAEVGVYAAKVEYGTEVAGVDVAAEGYIGAQAEGEADFRVNPVTGTAIASVGASAFVGGRIDGSASKEFDVAGVKADVGARGSVSYGLGGKFEAEAGLDDGVFKADVDIGATVGLGGEFGFTAELDVQDAAENMVDVAEEGVDWLWKNI